MRIVRCDTCGKWIGFEHNLDTLQTDECDYEQCPNCGSIEGLMDVDEGCYFSKDEIKKLWNLFGEIPIDDCDHIVEQFMGWPVGTDRFEIWHWFDERYAGGVHALTIYAEEEEQ